MYTVGFTYLYYCDTYPQSGPGTGSDYLEKYPEQSAQVPRQILCSDYQDSGEGYGNDKTHYPTLGFSLPHDINGSLGGKEVRNG